MVPPGWNDGAGGNERRAGLATGQRGVELSYASIEKFCKPILHEIY